MVSHGHVAMQLQFLMYWPFIRHETSAIALPPKNQKNRRENVHQYGAARLCGLAGIYWRQSIENIDELIDEGLTFDTEQEVLKVIIREVRSPAGVAPQFKCGHVRLFFSHTIFGLTATESITRLISRKRRVCRLAGFGR